jgi:hypothetical protein
MDTITTSDDTRIYFRTGEADNRSFSATGGRSMRMRETTR